MHRYGPDEAAEFFSLVGGAVAPGHQIAQAFADGTVGYALRGSRGHAIVVGCYAMYAHGIEVQIDTRRGYRRRGIASRLATRMLEECGRRRLACHWDAMNEASVALARRLGFRERRRYRCIELSRED
jgi:GNAT superfamily N-acetyltransferase